MHTLYPPLHHADSDDTTPNGDNNDNSQVLPPELRENFDQMRALVRAQSRAQDEKEEERARKNARQMALKTALAVEKEFSQLRNGIAELEALVAQQEGVAATTFPSLPPMIPQDHVDDEEEDDEEEEECEAPVKTEKKVISES